MTINYDFVGGPLDGQRKSLEESAMPLVVDGGTYRPTGTGHSLGEQPLVRTVKWTEGEAPGGSAPIEVGDPFPLDEGNVGGCSALRVDGSGVFLAACVLDKDHDGKHVASDGQTVVEVWG